MTQGVSDRPWHGRNQAVHPGHQAHNPSQIHRRGEDPHCPRGLPPRHAHQRPLSPGRYPPWHLLCLADQPQSITLILEKSVAQSSLASLYGMLARQCPGRWELLQMCYVPHSPPGVPQPLDAIGLTDKYQTSPTYASACQTVRRQNVGKFLTCPTDMLSKNQSR